MNFLIAPDTKELDEYCSLRCFLHQTGDGLWNDCVEAVPVT